MAPDVVKKQTIRFPNNSEALVVFRSAADTAEAVVNALDVKPYKAVILVLGGADIAPELVQRLTQLFGRGIARAAAEANAVVIDGAVDSGVVSLMGEGVAGRGHKSTLVGVAPADKVMLPGGTGGGEPLEPNHSHFVLVEGNGSGNETATMYDLAGVLTAKKPPQTRGTRGQDPAKTATKIPVLAVLAGGAADARDAVLSAVRQNIPIIVVEGSGGMADEIAAAWKQRETLPDEPRLAEIIADGEVHLHRLSNPVKGIERLIIREFGIDNVLMQAWETFANYDMNANTQQRKFTRLQLAILLLGVLGTALAIGQQVFAPKDPKDGTLLPVSLIRDGNGNLQFGWWLLRYILIVIPILLTVLVTAASRFKQGNKWLLLRAGAESIKREIYRYRSRAMDYKEKPEQQLAKRVEDISRRTMRTEVNSSALVPYDKTKGFPPYMYAAQGGDDGFSYLTPDRYVEVRLSDQLNYFQKKAVTLERQLKVLFWLTFIIGGLGTFLAAVGQQVWVALTTAVIAAIGTHLGYRQTENTLTKYNQAATDLSNVKAWWNALSAEEQAQQENIDSLVEHTEQVLQSELDGWVQQMQNALVELRKGQEPAPEREENREPQEPQQPQPPKEQQGTNGQPTNGKPDGAAQPPLKPVGGQPPAEQGTGVEEEEQADAAEPSGRAGGGAGGGADGQQADENAVVGAGTALPPPGGNKEKTP